jgi:hypothetical protein
MLFDCSAARSGDGQDSGGLCRRMPSVHGGLIRQRFSIATAQTRSSQMSRETIMADDKSRASGSDRDRINVNQDYELRDWAKKFGVTPEELKKAVQAVGDRADKVKEHLSSNRAA